MAERAARAVLPVGGAGSVSTAWWGMICLIATEAILFVYLIFSYAYLASQQGGPWPPTGAPSLKLVIPNTVILIGSSFVVAWGQRGFRRTRNAARLALALAGTVLLGTAFVAVQGVEWAGKPFDFSTNAYSSMFFLLTGVHMAHVIVGLLMLVMLLVWTVTGKFNAEHHEHIALGALYWHFVDAVWIAVFITAYILPQVS
jgi:heme/copper-type cytochrome/quinol oxidase subunit 3